MQAAIVYLLEDVIVPEADDGIAIRLDPSRALPVGRAFGMLAAVEFDDEPEFDAGKIGDVSADRNCLLNFAPSIWRERRRCQSLFSTAVASRRNLRAMGVSFFFNVTTPSPNPLPAGERALMGKGL